MGEKPPRGDPGREPNLELPRLRLSRPRARRRRTRARIPAGLAVPVTGLIVGAVGTGITYGGMHGCVAVNGTPSCGEPGLGYLVAVAAIMVALGALLLRAARVREPVGTSFLAIGILAVVLLIGLTSVIFSAWMFVVIPLVTAATYLAARWVTSRFVDPGEPPPGPDVR